MIRQAAAGESAGFAVRIENVSKRYVLGARHEPRTFRDVLSGLASRRRREEEREARELWALRDVSFDVRRGEAIGIIGQNGAGKSTLLKILSRITEPTAGRVEIRGRVSSLLEVGTGFHGELTGRENIQLNGAILGMTRQEVRERFDQIVAFADVERFIDTPVKYYSSGMYMRLAFAVAAHLEPEILIIDEVLAVGDVAFQSKCIRKMNEVASQGRTVLFVSHNMPAVKSLCSTAVWLKQGSIVDRGPSETIVNRYLQHATSVAGMDEAASVIAAFPPDPVFKLNAIEVRQGGVLTNTLLAGEKTEVVVDYEVFSTTLGLHVTFGLYDLEDALVFESLHNGDVDAAPVVEAGRYVATAEIPADLLAPRPYQLRVGASIADVRNLVPDFVRINVDVRASGIVNRAYPGYLTPGRVAPHIEWRVQCV